MGKKYTIDGRPRKSGIGKFILGIFLGFVMCLGTIAGLGWFAYENLSIRWVNETFNVGLDLGSQDLNNKTVKELVASAVSLTEKIDTYTLNDLNKDFGISFGDKLMGIDITDLNDVPIKELDVAVQDKFESISADEIKDIVDLSDMDLILNKTNTYYVSGNRLYEDAALSKQVDKSLVDYIVRSETVEIKKQIRPINNNKVEFELRYLPLTKAFGGFMDTMGDKITIGELVDKQNGFGVNLPEYLHDTAEKRSKTINEINDVVENLKLAEFLGYTISGNDVYNGTEKVSGIVAKLSKKTVKELESVETIINESTIAEVLDYSYEGGKYYYMDGTTKKEVKGIMKSLATTEVQNLTKEIENITVLKALGYTTFTKSDSSKGYKDENGNEVTGVLTIIDLENTTITQMASKIQTAITTSTLGTLQAKGVIAASYDLTAQVSNTNATFNSEPLDGKMLKDLNIDQIMVVLTTVFKK